MRLAKLEHQAFSLEGGLQFQSLIDFDQTFGPDQSEAQPFGKTGKGRLYAKFAC